MTTPSRPGEVVLAILDQIGELTNLRNLSPSEVRVILNVFYRMVDDLNKGHSDDAMNRALMSLIVELAEGKRFSEEPDPMNFVAFTAN